MGNWIPNDPTFVAQLLKISSSFTPPPPEGFVSPMTWGLETHIFERFGQAGVPKEKISLIKDTFHFISPDQSPTQVIESFRRFYGPTMNAYEAADKNGKVEELHIVRNQGRPPCAIESKGHVPAGENRQHSHEYGNRSP